MTTTLRITIAALASTSLAACATNRVTEDEVAEVKAEAEWMLEDLEAVEEATEGADAAGESQSLATFFETYDQERLEMLPETKAYRGIRDEDYGKWNDDSDAAVIARHQHMLLSRTEMLNWFDVDKLSDADALSYRLFDAMVSRAERTHQYRDNTYLFNQMRGAPES